MRQTILGISRASVSVAQRRARIHEIGLLLRAVRACWAAGRTMSLTRDDTVRVTRQDGPAMDPLGARGASGRRTQPESVRTTPCCA